MQDIQYALRLLRRAPGFAATAILTLAIGIGADTAMFSVVNGVLLQPLPYAQPERLVRVFEEASERPKFPVSPGTFHDIRAEVTSFEAVAAYERSDLQLSGGDRPEHLRAMRVTSGFFGLLGAAPAIGREFERAEEAPGSEDVVVLSHALWQRRFGGDPRILNRSLTLSGRPYRVIGVLRPDFQHVGSAYRSYAHAEPVDAWWVRSIRPVPEPGDRTGHFLNVIARLRPGVSPSQAEQEVRALASRLTGRHPKTNTGWSATTSDLKEEIVGDSRSTIVALAGAVQLVLLLACANVAGLLLGRATGRAGEIGVRAALGASRLRLARQLLVESCVIALAGGLAGLALAALFVRLVARFGPDTIPRLQLVEINGAMAAYAIGASVLTALIFGVAPAWQLARTGATATLKQSGRGAVGSGHDGLRRAFVAAQIALAFVLVVGAGLLLRSFVALARTDPGFRPAGVLTAVVNLPGARYDDAAADVFYRRLSERLAVLPGVRAVGLGSALPWTGYDENTGFAIPGRTFPPMQGPEGRYNAVTPGFFRALDVPVIAGRVVAAGDTADTARVIVVNEALARKYFDTPQRAVGARVRVWGAERTIVGVVGSVKDAPWSSAAMPALYYPKSQQTVGGDMMLALRADGDAGAFAVPILRVMHQIDPALPLARVRTLDEVAGAAFAGRRFALAIVGAFGLTALFLAVVGVYGVMAQAVGQRRQEFGVRMALGATTRDIIVLVVGGGAWLAIGGLAAGVTLALGTTRLLGSLLYEVRAVDPLTFVGVAALLFAAAAIASYVPAWRATRVDPAVALRDS